MTRPRDQYVAEALNLAPWEQVAYLSLLGTEPWRLYRSGMHRTLLLEMYAVDETFETFLAGIQTVLTACARALPDLNTLHAPIAVMRARMTASALRTFEMQEHFLDHHFLTGVLGVPESDPRSADLDRIATFMLDVLYQDDDFYEPAYREPMVRTWLGYCDVAAGIEPQPAAGAVS